MAHVKKKDFELTGLERLKIIAATDIVVPYINEAVLTTRQMAEGNVQFQTTLDQQHFDGLASRQFGGIAMMLEAVTGYAAQTVLATEQSHTLLDMNFKFYHPVPTNMVLILEAKVIHTKRQVILTEGFIRDAQGVLYAYTTTTHMIVRGQERIIKAPLG